MSKQINIKFDNEAIDVLKELKKYSDAESYVDVIRNALGFYHWVCVQEKDGLQIATIDENQELKKTVLKIFKF